MLATIDRIARTTTDGGSLAYRAHSDAPTLSDFAAAAAARREVLAADENLREAIAQADELRRAAQLRWQRALAALDAATADLNGDCGRGLQTVAA